MSWATHHLVLVITTKLDNGPGNNNLYTGEATQGPHTSHHTHSQGVPVKTGMREQNRNDITPMHTQC